MESRAFRIHVSIELLLPAEDGEVKRQHYGLEACSLRSP